MRVLCGTTACCGYHKVLRTTSQPSCVLASGFAECCHCGAGATRSKRKHNRGACRLPVPRHELEGRVLSSGAHKTARSPGSPVAGQIDSPASSREAPAPLRPERPLAVAGTGGACECQPPVAWCRWALARAKNTGAGVCIPLNMAAEPQAGSPLRPDLVFLAQACPLAGFPP